MHKFKANDNFAAILAYLSVCIIWGSTYLVIRIGVKDFPPELFAGIRFVIAGSIMLLFAAIRKQQFPKTIADVGRISLIGVFLILGGNGLVVFAEQWVDSGITAIILATVPLFIALLEMLLPGGSTINAKGWIGLLTGFAGVILLVFSSMQSASINTLGGLLIIVAAISWAAGTVYSKSIKPSGHIITIIGIQMLAGGLGQCITGGLLGEFNRMHFSYNTFYSMLYLIFIGSILGYGSYTFLLQKWSAAKAGTYAYVNPIVAVLLGALILKEKISPGVILSTLVILGGVFLVQLSKKPKTDLKIIAEVEASTIT